MKAYPQQHEPWRPDYPPVWSFMLGGKAVDVQRPQNNKALQKNIRSFSDARKAIIKAMKL